MYRLYDVKLTKLSLNDNGLKTNEVIGQSVFLPTIGESFKVFAEPLSDGAYGRVVTTSALKALRTVSESIYEFDTENSTYRLEIQPE